MLRLFCYKKRQSKRTRVGALKYTTSARPALHTWGAVILGLGSFGTGYTIVKYDKEIVDLLSSAIETNEEQNHEETNTESVNDTNKQNHEQIEMLSGEQTTEQQTPTNEIQDPDFLDAQQLDEFVQLFCTGIDQISKKMETIHTVESIQLQINELQKHLQIVLTELEDPNLMQKSTYPDLEQIQNEFQLVSELVSQSCARTEMLLAEQEHQHDEAMKQASLYLLGPLSRQADEIKRKQEEVIEQMNKEHELLIQEIKDQYTVKARLIAAEYERENAELDEGYFELRRKLAAAFKQEYDAKTSAALEEKNRTIEEHFLQDWNHLKAIQEENNLDIQKLSDYSKDQTANINVVLETHRRSLEVLDHVEALLLLQSAQRKSPKPFLKTYHKITQVTMNEPQLAAAIAKLSLHDASKGIKTLPQLREDFDGVGQQIRQHSLKKLLDLPNKGLASKIVDIAKSEPPASVMAPGTDDSAVISRCGYYLARSSLDSALRELSQLEGELAEFYVDWIKDAKARQNFDAAVQIFANRVHQDLDSANQQDPPK